MQGCTVPQDTIVTEMEGGRSRNLEEVRRVLEYQGSIFFEKTLPRTSAQNLHTSKSHLGIPRQFIDSHGDKFGEILHLVAGPTTRIWTLVLYIIRPNYMNKAKCARLPIRLDRGWNEFATFHGLVENDRLIFSLKAYSSFEVYIFDRNGEPKEFSFPTWRLPSIGVHELPQKKGYGKSGKRATKVQRRAMAAAQLVKDQIARDRKRTYNLNARRKKKAISSQKQLHSALDIFKPHFVHKIPLHYRHIPGVMGQKPSDDVHQELVMPFTKNFVETSQDFVETRIIPIGFENEIQGQTETHTSPPSFLSPSTFRNNNLGRNVRVQTVIVLTGTPETNGEAGDRATHSSPVLQSDPSPVVQSILLPIVQYYPSAAVQSDPPAIVQSEPSADVQPLVLESGRVSEQPIVTIPTANGGTRRKHHRPWTLGEVTLLVECVARCGVGKWADIKKLGFSSVGYRTVDDLKDKWRNLVRASQAQVHPPKQGERKKQSSSIPAPILARVRELAFVLNQIPLDTVFVSSSNRKWRVVHPK